MGGLTWLRVDARHAQKHLNLAATRMTRAARTPSVALYCRVRYNLSRHLPDEEVQNDSVGLTTSGNSLLRRIMRHLEGRMHRRDFISLLGGALRGRSLRGRSKAGGCGVSGSLTRLLRTIRKRRSVTEHSCRDCKALGWAVAATFGLPLRRCRSHSSQRRQDDYGSAKQGERNTDHLCERRPLTSPRGLGVGVLPR